MNIHPTAIVSPEARIGEGADIGPYAIVEAGASIGPNATLAAHAIVRRGVTVGRNLRLDSFAVLGSLPQDLKFSFEKCPDAAVVLGDDLWIREYATVSISTVPGKPTRVGNDVFMMAASHVAHDCQVDDGVILAHSALLGGHAHIGAGAIIGGHASVHQFCRIGTRAMVAAASMITLDIPPYALAADRNRLSGFNLIGLRRGGVPATTIGDLKDCFRAVYAGGNPAERAREALASGLPQTDMGRTFVEFFLSGKRGFAKPNLARPGKPSGES